MTVENSALGEGLYWYAEKLTWGYEGVDKDHAEAVKLFRQAAELGFTDAYLRLGQLREYGKGTSIDPKGALESYKAAIKAGNFFGLAFIARLVGRSRQSEQAGKFWDAFMEALSADPEPTFHAAKPGELLHVYIATQLRLGSQPQYLTTLLRHRIGIVAHHQRLLEHSAEDDQLDQLSAVSDWVYAHLGPWPADGTGI